MASGIIPSAGFTRTLFSVEEAMIVNMDFPFLMFCTGDERSPDSQSALCVKSERIFFFVLCLLLPFGEKKKFPASHFIGFVLFPVVLTFTLHDIRTRIISNKFSHFITPGWNAEGLWLPGRLDVEWMLPLSSFLFEFIYLYECAYGHSPVFNGEYTSGQLVQQNT
jgi:hypothetical protein